jgi:cysteine-rich repeat protein
MTGEKLLAVGAVIIAIIALIIGGAAYMKEGEPGPIGPQGEPGEMGPPGENGTDGEDCEINEPPTIELFYCGDGIMSHGEWCDDGNEVGGDGCDCDCTADGPPYRYTLGVYIEDPEDDKLTIDVYYKFYFGANWILLEHDIGYSGHHAYHIYSMGPISSSDWLYWCVEVTDGPNLVWAYHNAPICNTPAP